jgi:hypothetical protein
MRAIPELLQGIIGRTVSMLDGCAPIETKNRLGRRHRRMRTTGIIISGSS